MKVIDPVCEMEIEDNEAAGRKFRVDSSAESVLPGNCLMNLVCHFL